MFLKTYGKIVNNSDIPAILNLETLHELFYFLGKANICIGNCDYYEMIDKRTAFGNYQGFKDKKGNIKAVLENGQFISGGSLQTIRLLDCKILTLNENKRCNPCQSYRRTLNTLSWRATKTLNDPSS